MRPLAYVYGAAYHCEHCSELAFGMNEAGDICGETEEGPIGVLAPWDEWQQFTGEPETLACDTCGEVIEEYDPTD